MKSEKISASLFVSLFFIHCGSTQVNQKDSSSKPTSPSSEKSLCAGAHPESTDGFGGGNGTQENPYLVCTNDQFRHIQGDMGSKRFFKLTSDLDFSTEGNIRIIAIAPFASIDGDGHRLKNVTIEHGHGYKDNGLFGQLTKDSSGNRDEIKNLIIENVKITGDGTEDGAGVIAGANWEGIISNVHVTGVISVIYSDSGLANWPVGGIVGRNSALIENSSFDGQITGVNAVGGIAGMNDGTIRNSTTSGSFQGRHGVGELIGIQLKSGLSVGNSSSVTISTSGTSGGLIGITCAGLSFTNCDLSN